MTRAHPWLCALTAPQRNSLIAAIVVICTTLLLYWFKFDSNITGFFRIGSILPLSPYLDPETTTIIPNELGYDGQQFLTLALDPFLNNPASIAALDNPPFRYRRIFYPLLSYSLGFGNSAIIPYVMVLINSLAIVVIIWCISDVLNRHTLPTWPALGILSIPGVWISLVFSTADLFNTMLISLVIYNYHLKRPIWAALALTLATLTRETSLLIGIAWLITSGWNRKYQDLRYSIPALIPMILWNYAVLTRFAATQIPGATDSFTIPLMGIMEKLTTLLNSGLNPKSIYDLYCFMLLILIIGVGIKLSLLDVKQNRLILISISLYSMVFIMSSINILDYFFNYPRTFIDLYILFFWISGISKVRYIQGTMMGGLLASSLFFLVGHS
ncbi:AZOBR_p60025 family cell surface glycopolymer formation protein [Spirulina major]|uniref:AZOBR_p60025 family cell surface glycopolymer formation protein n=1 Tax=Spirulina major TaxID=270636 RepID=UPI000934F041|nr:hypothetical protein [Spirulina major]